MKYKRIISLAETCSLSLSRSLSLSLSRSLSFFRQGYGAGALPPTPRAGAPQVRETLNSACTHHQGKDRAKRTKVGEGVRFARNSFDGWHEKSIQLE